MSSAAVKARSASRPSCARSGPPPSPPSLRPGVSLLFSRHSRPVPPPSVVLTSKSALPRLYRPVPPPALGRQAPGTAHSPRGHTAGPSRAQIQVGEAPLVVPAATPECHASTQRIRARGAVRARTVTRARWQAVAARVGSAGALVSGERIWWTRGAGGGATARV